METYFSKIKKRILEYAEFRGFSKRKIYVDTGIANGTLDKGSGLSEPNIEKFISTYKEINPAWLVTGKGDMLLANGSPIQNEDSTKKEPQELVLREAEVSYQASNTKLVLVTVNNKGKENIVLVHAESEKDYLSAFSDPSYIGKLPSFTIPILQNGFLRAFEVKDYSMLSEEGKGLCPSDIVIADHVKNPGDIKDSQVYVIVSKAHGIIIKRCLNRIREENVVICISDNTHGGYSPIRLSSNQIEEVWEFKALISCQIPKPGDLMARLNNLEARLTLIEKRELNSFHSQ